MNWIKSWIKHRNFRPVKWWIPEILNHLHLPKFIANKVRRQEVAEVILDGRRRGYTWCYDLYRKVAKRAPRKSK